MPSRASAHLQSSATARSSGTAPRPSPRRRRRAPRAPCGDEVGLLELVAAAEVGDAVAAFAVGPETLVLAVAVLADDGGRGIEDDLRRPVVAFELDDVRLAEILLEIEDVPQVGAAPLVDRLVRIADDGEVAVHLGEAADQHVLRAVRVLVFVDHDEPELFGVLGSYRRRLLEQVDRPEQQIVEVERVALLQRLQVVGVHLRDLLVALVRAGGGVEGVRPFHPVLGVTDPRQRRARLNEAVVDLQRLERLLDDRELIR